MTDAALGLIPTLGPAFVAVLVALGCFGVPVPSSIALVMGGAFAASGEMALVPLLAWAYAGALAGDQAGYALGLVARGPVTRFLTGTPARAARHAQATDRLRRWGRSAVFFSRWLLAPLGPPLNLASGAGGLGWARFTQADLAGEAVWILTYIGLGYGFSGSIAALVALLGDAIWFVLAAGTALALGLRLTARLRQARGAGGPVSR